MTGGGLGRGSILALLSTFVRPMLLTHYTSVHSRLSWFLGMTSVPILHNFCPNRGQRLSIFLTVGMTPHMGITHTRTHARTHARTQTDLTDSTALHLHLVTHKQTDSSYTHTHSQTDLTDSSTVHLHRPTQTFHVIIGT